MLQLTFNGLCKISLIVFWELIKSVGKFNSGRRWEWSMWGSILGRLFSKIRRELRKIRR
ncbi:unnamed protein product [Meloidogyne enterolobii]|uniref:Uncharacterized protein n=1 Tax=Meloidogyne enterolobii TaxID=390850 RepID=A0ACB0Z0T4_MELEN